VKEYTDNLEPAWARLGILFACEPARSTPDVERILVDTARRLGENGRLYPLVVTWLVEFGHCVARHRLRRLVGAAPAQSKAGMGLLLEAAIELGAPSDLRLVAAVCVPSARPGPLAESFRDDPAFVAMARKVASPLSLKWGLWAPEVEPRPQVIRTGRWVLEHNPSLQQRLVRKGDLRCSILESLRWDSGGTAKSEAELARLTGATRAAVRKSLVALVCEGELTVARHVGNRRDNVVTLRAA
jgi:hypothetical protein